ncbi:MAG TPA: type II secretion system F family protein, partial [Candidatus Paceibacterota bacterium]|nr:type II secretion system F family protein [Candidatus Paceibacterota bacterium]
GSEEKRVVDAPSRFAVYEQIQKEGSSVISLEEGGGGNLFTKLAQVSISTGVSMQERITFTKNLAAMLGAGLTLSRALSVIVRQTSNKSLKKIVTDLETKVKQGTSFHEALADHKKMFSPLFIAMTKAGEESGTLSDSLAVIARQMDSAYTLQKKIQGAMIYPAVILVAVAIIGVLMMVFVVPTLSATFASLEVELPTSTKIIIGISDFMKDNAILTFLGVGLAIFGTIFFVRSKLGSAIVLRIALKLPVIGELVKETMSARAARALSSLLSSGVEMLSAISITKEIVGARMFSKVLAEAEDRVRKGEPLSAAFANYPKLYPVFVADMISVGEETGKVADMLGQVAHYYETDVEDRTKDLSTIIEPMLMLLIGVFVGIFALSMMSPMYSLSSKI